MLRYLSDEWFAAADDALRKHKGLRSATADLRLTVGQVVVDDGADGASYVVRLDHGDNRIEPGPIDAADVTFTTDRATAVEIASGAVSAQTAFLDGRLRLSGDMGALIAHHQALAGIEDVLASVRARTEYA